VDPYRLPVALDRDRFPRLQLVNTGSETLRGVTVLATGSGRVLAPATAVLAPGDHLDLSVLGADPARDTVLIVRWLRPDGTEWLWRAAL
jgi:hypothetical protein